MTGPDIRWRRAPRGGAPGAPDEASRGASCCRLRWPSPRAAALPRQSSPPPFDVLEQTIPELQAAMETGRVTSRQIVAQYLARIEAYDRRGPALRAMVGINRAALDEAAALDRERVESGPRGPLHGIPVVVKDNYDVAGLPTSAGSAALAGWHPPDDAFQVARLKTAGAVIIGKANMHELAYGLTTVSSAGGQTRNPYDPTRNPGGSSGGTGAAVAAGFAAAGMGTDTCGSIRVPSAHHALAGLRGTRRAGRSRPVPGQGRDSLRAGGRRGGRRAHRAAGRPRKADLLRHGRNLHRRGLVRRRL